MRTLTLRDALRLHELLLAATGGTAGVRDVGTLESALYHAYASFDGKDLYPTIEEKAARQAYAIVRNHAFVDGNKRMGLLVMLTFLESNGIKLAFESAELVELGLGVAAGSIDAGQVLAWIQEHKV